MNARSLVFFSSKKCFKCLHRSLSLHCISQITYTRSHFYSVSQYQPQRFFPLFLSLLVCHVYAIYDIYSLVNLIKLFFLIGQAHYSTPFALHSNYSVNKCSSKKKHASEWQYDTVCVLVCCCLYALHWSVNSEVEASKQASKQENVNKRKCTFVQAYTKPSEKK